MRRPALVSIKPSLYVNMRKAFFFVAIKVPPLKVCTNTQVSEWLESNQSFRGDILFGEIFLFLEIFS